MAMPFHNLDHVGEIVFVRWIVRRNLLDVLPKKTGVETINAGIDFTDLQLFRRRYLLFDDGRHGAISVAQDAAVSSSVSYFGSDNAPAFRIVAHLEESLQRPGAQQGPVPIQNQ